MVRVHPVGCMVHLFSDNGISNGQSLLASTVHCTLDTLRFSYRSITPHSHQLLHVQLFKSVHNSEPVLMCAQFVVCHINTIEIRTVCEPAITSESSGTLFHMYRNFTIDVHLDTCAVIYVHQYRSPIFSVLRTSNIFHAR